MKACALYGVNDLRYETDYSIPPLEAQQVRVKIRAAGICGSDIPRVFTKGTYQFPTIIGHEFAGEITAVSKHVTDDYLGKRVAVYPLLPCFECCSCRIGEYSLCEDYDYYGSRRDGAFAEYLNVNVWNLIPIPDDVSYEQAAMCEPTAVAIHALDKGEIQEADIVVISGAGTIGLILAQLARAYGASKVVLLDVDERKLQFAKTLGFDLGINGGANDLAEQFLQMTGKQYADAVIESSGAASSVANCFKLAKRFGRVVLMGNPSGDIHIKQSDYWEILRKELRLLGTWNSRYNDETNDWKRAIKMMQEGSVNLETLITHRYNFAECNQAFQMMKGQKELSLKVMFINE